MFTITKHLLVLVCAALLSAGVIPLRAGERSDKCQACDDTEKMRKEEWKKLSPEEREAKRKEIVARLEKRIAALREKQTNGVITPQETRELNRSEQILKRFEQNPPGGKKADGTNSVPQAK